MIVMVNDKKRWKLLPCSMVTMVPVLPNGVPRGDRPAQPPRIWTSWSAPRVVTKRGLPAMKTDEWGIYTTKKVGFMQTNGV